MSRLFYIHFIRERKRKIVQQALSPKSREPNVENNKTTCMTPSVKRDTFDQTNQPISDASTSRRKNTIQNITMMRACTNINVHLTLHISVHFVDSATTPAQPSTTTHLQYQSELTFVNEGSYKDLIQ
jgi:hypothetical protein